VSQFGDRPAANRSLSPVFSGDGQTLVFGSWAPDLMSGDFNLGGDVFAYSIYASGAIPIFCARLSLGTNIPQQPLIIWPAPPGKSYRVQYKTNLTDSAWQNLNNGVTVVGGQAYCSDLAPAAVHRFYRVMAY